MSMIGCAIFIPFLPLSAKHYPGRFLYYFLRCASTHTPLATLSITSRLKFKVRNISRITIIRFPTFLHLPFQPTQKTTSSQEKEFNPPRTFIIFLVSLPSQCQTRMYKMRLTFPYEKRLLYSGKSLSSLSMDCVYLSNFL
jgi:hypothetical protein